MRSESELKTRAYLRRRREERRQQLITARLINACCAAGMIISMACLLYLEWPVLVVAFG